MKILIPIMTLFLASCGVHNHRYDADQDAYYEDDYYAYDNYDPYYGYGSSEYSTAGDGVYYNNYNYNNYNYYPDRWGVTYSNVDYSPFRYPRVGFYLSSGYNCGYSYWSNCSSGFFGSSYYGSGYYASNWWPSYGFGLSYSSYYYDNYYWYNHWRNRNYYHNRPTQRGYYSARNEAGRLTNGRYYSNYKNNQSRSNNNQRSGQRNGNRSNPKPVNRGRSTGNRTINRSSGNRTNQPAQRSRQQSAILNPNGSNYRQSTGVQNSARTAVTGRSNSQSNSRDLQSNVRQNYVERNLPNNRYQKPALVTSNVTNQRGNQTNRVRQTNQLRQIARDNQKPQQQPQVRVKPMNSQAPVYYNNTRPNAVRQPVVQGQSNRNNTQRSDVQRSNINQQAPVRSPYVNNRVAQSRPQQQASPQQPVNAPVAKPQRKERSRSKSTNSDKSSSRDQSSRSSGRERQR